jgi:hypothetical protein
MLLERKKVIKMTCIRGIQSAAKAFCLIWVATAVIPSPISAQTVTYNYADRVNFTEFKTYQWVNIEGASATDPTLDMEIRTAIDAQLAMRGISKSVDGAQLLVGYQVSQARVIQIAMLNDYWQYGPGWRESAWYGYSRGLVVDDVSKLSTDTGAEIRFGDLVVDAYDSSHRDLVWRGRVTKAINFGQDSKERQRQLTNAVSKLIHTFPYHPKELSSGWSR